MVRLFRGHESYFLTVQNKIHAVSKLNIKKQQQIKINFDIFDMFDSF